MNLFSMWCVRLTLAYTLAQEYGLKGVWFAMAVELTFRGIIFLIRIWRGNWMKAMKPTATAA
jgi:Na+-driven multidrug efflux pump